MARPKSLQPQYCHHKASGRAYVTIDGKRVYLGDYGTPASRDKYQCVVAEWIGRGRKPDPLGQAPAGDSPLPLTLTELIAKFWTHARGYYVGADGTPSKELENFKLALRPLNQHCGAMAAAHFGPRNLRDLRERMLKPTPAAGKVRALPGWSRKYANRQMGRVRQMFAWAVGEELITPDVYQRLAAVKGLRRGKCEARETEAVGPVPEAYVEAALPFLSRQIVAMIRLQLLTGMRPGEACAMRGVDLDAGGELWAYRPARHKTEHHGHRRIVYLGPRAKEIVRPFLQPDLAAYLFSPAEAEAERREGMHRARKTPLSCGNVPGSNRKGGTAKRRPGERYRVSSYAHAIIRACDKADEWAKAGKVIDEKERLVPRWHPHQLRHNAATRLRKEFGLEAAQVILGHRTLSVTQIYAEKNVEAARKIMGEVG